ncbi:hypothetical protein K435DRAFT_855175 [Dendrothele bispora CBS 962.96]|uniref:Uncharacterized protein n=1 Tax=Dendrothele bispora (strain CBS 962.96) TaxID=1314807 RepID=A0A4S8MBQ5_DENBC|nr:hypothetical protein K435DRAFT_855175 [Dendrothele bispora CBS 962.96]
MDLHCSHSTKLVLRIHAPVPRSLRTHPYKRVRYNIHHQRKPPAISQTEMERFLDAICSLNVPSPTLPTPTPTPEPATATPRTLPKPNPPSRPSSPVRGGQE